MRLNLKNRLSRLDCDDESAGGLDINIGRCVELVVICQMLR
jgi:hypothetical protein